MLLANNLSYIRDSKELFNNLNISLSPNKIIHIQGRNGLGKTTLINILATILTPTSGEIYWNGKNIKKNYYEYYNNLTYIMDSKTSNSELTVMENIVFWKKLFSSPIKKNELDSILNLLNLSNCKNKKVNILSSGEIKKLELCRLVIERKKIWLLDEPYVGLDESTTDLINETFINHVKNEGMIIFASHYNPELQNMEIIKLENYANL